MMDKLYERANFLEKTIWAPESLIIFHLCAVTRCYPYDCPQWDENYCFLRFNNPKWLEKNRFR